MGKKVVIKRLKKFALSLPPGHPLREVLLIEDDEMDAEMFLAHMTIWLRLAAFHQPPGGR